MKRRIIPYRLNLKHTAKMLRKNMSLPEILLWQELKGRKLKGYQFNRQRPIDNYIVDFYCKDLLLVIEVDGEDHNLREVRVNDQVRQAILESYGIQFLRFTNEEVLDNISTVINKIQEWIISKELRGRNSGTHP